MKQSKKSPPAPIAKPLPSKSRQLDVVEEPGVSIDRVKAKLAIGATIPNASTALDYSIGLFPDINLNECAKQMNSEIRDVNGGNLDSLEGMLAAQAIALNAIFNNFAKRAAHADVMPKLEAYMRLALKAQSQCRTTVEAIAEIKYPKTATFIRQANIAGQQQVNNNAAAADTQTNTHGRARTKNITPTNELLTKAPYAAMDTGGTRAPVGTHPSMETVGAVHRAKD